MESEQPLSVAIIATLNRARNALSPETGSTVYRFTDKNIDQLPQGDNTPLNGVLIQAPGVSQDSYGQGQSQIHIHGLNGGGIQYRLNGIFLPEPVSSFGQLFSSYFIKSVTLIDNFMPAQFGYRNEGVIDIHSKDGCPDWGRLSITAGSAARFQPSLQYGGVPNRSDYRSGFYYQSALGVQSPTRTPTPEHDCTSEGQGFSYLSVFAHSRTRLQSNYWAPPLTPTRFRVNLTCQWRSLSSGLLITRTRRIPAQLNSSRTISGRTLRCKAPQVQTRLSTRVVQPLLQFEVQSRPRWRSRIQWHR